MRRWRFEHMISPVAAIVLASGCGAATESTTEQPRLPQAPAVALSLSSPRSRAGVESVTLSWTSERAASCAASGAWSGTLATVGSQSVRPDTVGRYAYGLQCVGAGGTASASATLEAWKPLSVLPTSYANFKDVGISTTSLPSKYVIRAYGDFFQDGRRSLFTATQTYDRTKPISEATSARYEFWHLQDTTWVVDNSILAPPAATCLHPRQALTADFNGDGKPDVVVACHGYDAPPFPGERSQVLLSGAGGVYTTSDASPEIGYWHGAAAADLNGDGRIDVITVAGRRPAVYLNDGTGHFVLDPGNRLASALPDAPWWTVQVADVNEDGLLDVLAGGAEWIDCPECAGCPTCSTAASTTLLLGLASGAFRAVELPPVSGDGLVLDFVLTGTGPTRTIWVNRTSGARGAPSYLGRTIQSVSWPALRSTVAYSNRSDKWLLWLIPLGANGSAGVGSDNSRDNLLPIRAP